MKTTIDIPHPLLEEALRLSSGKSESEVVVRALEDFVCRQKAQDLKNFKGRVNLEVDLDQLRDRR